MPGTGAKPRSGRASSRPLVYGWRGPGAPKKGPASADLDDPARVHHGDPVRGHAPGRRQVVGDHQQRAALAGVAAQPSTVRSTRSRSSPVVGSSASSSGAIPDEGEGGGGALGRAAGEFVRVAVEHRVRQAHVVGQAADGRRGSGSPVAAPAASPPAGRGRCARGEVGGGACGTRPMRRPAPSGGGSAPAPEQVDVPAEVDRAARGLRVGREQAEQGGGEHRLAAAALADQREARPRHEGEARRR